jgi:3D (Asp-Asp-Asp) domain-containing protein
VAAIQDLVMPRAGRGWQRFFAQTGLCLAAAAVTVGTAVGAKELQGRTHVPPLAMVETTGGAILPVLGTPDRDAEPELLAAPELTEEEETAAVAPEFPDHAFDPDVRWFNGRPARPAKKVWMTVTGYSADARSCGDSADGITATLHSVKTNNGNLVAADPKVLPYGSMLSIPGYDGGDIVPVLDCGGAIKGSRLDLLFPTHEAAIKWGKKRIMVTVWQYCDGKPAENPRKLR